MIKRYCKGLYIELRMNSSKILGLSIFRKRKWIAKNEQFLMNSGSRDAKLYQTPSFNIAIFYGITKLVPNHHIDQRSAKFFPGTPKLSNFFFEIFIFQNFRGLRHR